MNRGELGGARNVYVVDVETTGLDPKEDRVVEFAMVQSFPDGDEPEVIINELTCPGRRIPPEVSAIHHIVDADVAGRPTLEIVVKDCGLWPSAANVGSGALFVAHNAPFDRSFLEPVIGPRKWIDTCRVAKHLWPDAPKFGNQVMRYYLELTVAMLAGASLQPHRALYDALVTEALFRAALARTEDLDELLKLSITPVLLKNIPLGTHFGKAFEDVPTGYLKWMATKTWDDEDLTFTINHWLRKAYPGRMRAL